MSRSVPGLLVERAAALDPDRLGDGDLHVVDVAPVPDRLEDRVGEAQGEDVLHRLLAEVVVDPEHLVLREVGVHELVERHRGGAVVAERLLDDDPAEAAFGLGPEPAAPSPEIAASKSCGMVER